jgi:hypothetical protein
LFLCYENPRNAVESLKKETARAIMVDFFPEIKNETENIAAQKHKHRLLTQRKFREKKKLLRRSKEAQRT